VTELRWVGPQDADVLLVAGALFDAAPDPQWTAEFLARSGHHLCIAYVDGVPAGFITGVELCHPDKGTEMYLYELGVEEEYREKGVEHALISALAGRAKERGCYGMWTLTDVENLAARRSYEAVGGTERGTQLTLDWQLTD